MVEKAQRFLFRWRGGLMAAVAVVVLGLANPTPGSLLLGALLALAGEGTRFWAIGHSRGHTRGLDVEAPFLATAGPYAHTRNPLYLGNSLNALGVAVAAAGGCPAARAQTILALSLGSLILVYGGIILLEEQHLSQLHGTVYAEYRRTVPRFIPALRAAGPRQGAFCLDSALYYERWSLAWWWLTWLYLLARCRS